VAFRYPCDRSVTWPGDAGLPSFVARRHSWGFNSSVALRRFDPAQDGWICFASPCASRTMRPTDPGFFAGPFVLSASGVSAGPGPRVVCRRSSTRRLIFVGVTDRLWRRTRSAKAIGQGLLLTAVRLLGFAPVCGPPRARHRCPPRRSCLGLCLSQGCRSRAASHDSSARVTGRARPRFRITSLRVVTCDACMRCRRGFPIRSWVFDRRARCGFPGRYAPPVPSAC
jgi:hypothetical protein